jgi:hypothetical protein
VVVDAAQGAWGLLKKPAGEKKEKGGSDILSEIPSQWLSKQRDENQGLLTAYFERAAEQAVALSTPRQSCCSGGMCL